MNFEDNSSIDNIGSIVNSLHYGPFAQYWWYKKIYLETNTEKFYPIRLHLKMTQNLKNLTMQTFISQGENNQPIFHCNCEKFFATEKSMSAAVNTIYRQYLESVQSTSKTRISGPKYFGFVNENHLQMLSKDIIFFPFTIKVDKFEMFVVNASYDEIKPANGYHITFVEKIRQEYYLFSQYFINNQFHVDSYLLTTGEKKYEFQNFDVNRLWESIGMFQSLSGKELFLFDNLELNHIIEEPLVRFKTMCSDWNQIVFERLHLEYMRNINSKDLTLSVLNHLHKRRSTLFEWHDLLYNFKITEKNNSVLDETMLRKIRAWKQLLVASGCKQIKIYRDKEYWSKADDISADLETLELFSETDSHSNLNLNSSQELRNNEHSDVNIFWKSFENAMNSNKRGPDNQHRILSIIAEKFTYSELKRRLNISNDLINAARKHARFYGEGAPILQEDRVTLTKNKFTEDQLKDLETFLHDKNNVSMSSYKTDTKTGNPILYLNATKKEMWEKYHEEYPNGLKRTSFMCKLDGQFKYREDLGGLCITCDFYGYQVFDSIIQLIKNSQLFEIEKTDLITKIETLRRHLKRGLEKEIKVLNNGFLEHTTCLNHCLLYAFGECKEEHSSFCNNCMSLFLVLNEIKKIGLVDTGKCEEYLDKLLYYMTHQLRKKYLNSQFNAALRELKNNGAVLVCDYKMKVIPKSSRETKQDFFGKEGWTLHTILVITSNNNGELIIRAFDHWSDDGKQDAWFTASAFDVVLPQIGENIEWVKIFSDNGGHYHNSELMVIISYWKKWYNLNVTKWQFLEPGEAKTIVDSHHAQLTHGFIRYTRLGNNISTGEDIVNANKNLAGTSLAKLIPDRSKKISVGTIPGISNYFTFMWPTDEREGIIEAYEIPNYGKPTIYSVSSIKKLLKNNDINKPNSTAINQTTAQSEWKINIPSQINTSVQTLTVTEIINKFLFINDNDDINLKNLLDERLMPGFALRSKQKFGKRGGKRLDLKVIEKLKEMFLAGNIEKDKKYSPEDMLKNLQACAENYEIEVDNIPSLHQIKSWISRFNQHHKKQAAEIASTSSN